MRPAIRRSAPLAAAALAVLLAACGGSGSTPAATPPSPALTTPTPPAPPTGRPTPTEVPGATGATPPATPMTTTETGWGTIVDSVPDAFPRYPGAEIAEVPEPVSAAFLASAPADEVASWYRDALEGLGLSTLGLSGPLEDGSYVLDMMGDLPECLLQLAARPAGESTMITVLYGAGCVGGGG